MKEKRMKKKRRKVRCQSEAKAIDSKMEYLPDELILNILSWVPTLELGNLRYVCKKWRNIVEVKNPLFRALHLSHSMSDNHLIVLKGRDALRFVDLASHRELAIKTPRIFVFYEIIGSCNGLLCLGSKDLHEILVMNPFTREHVFLYMDSPFESGSISSWGFGFDFVNKIFKVVVTVRYKLDTGSELRICDLDSHKISSWRHIDIGGKETFDFNFSSESPACFCNGRLHWINKDDDGWVNIVSFDLANEEFRLVPTPDCLHNRRKYDLFVLRGCLCIIRSQASTTPRLQIWVMKEYGVKESWVKEVDTEPLIPKTFPSHLDKSQNKRWRLTLKGLGSVRDGEVLLKCKRRECEEAILVSSDPRCEQFEFLELKSSLFRNASVIHTASLNWI